jgi:enoyl-CoA hydratase
MTYECFDVSVKQGIAHIQMSRPDKRNNMNRAFWRELPQIIQEIDAQAQARVIVLSSTGPHFCGGIDVSMFGPSDEKDPNAGLATHHAKRQKGLKFLDTVKTMQDSLSAMEACRLPVLVAIQGGCIGGGVDLVTACDIRYATRDAFITIYETKIGMTADVGTFPRLVKLIPEGIVRELAYTGRRMSADEGMNIGLVNRVFDTHEEMLEGVMEVAREIAANAPLAVHGCKRAITYARDHTTQEGLDWIGLWNASMLHPEEIREAMGARAEKREPDFTDLPKRKIS